MPEEAIGKSQFAEKQYGEKKFERVYNRIIKRYPEAFLELMAAGYNKYSKVLTPGEQAIFLKYKP